MRGFLPGFGYQCGVFFSSQVVYVEAVFAKNHSYSVVMALTAVTVSGEPFGVLQPVFPLALCARWSARYGTFPRIPDPDRDRPMPS